MTDTPIGAAPAAPAQPPAPDVPATIALTVEAWISQHLHNSPVSRATEAMNHLRAAIPHLIEKLEEL